MPDETQDDTLITLTADIVAAHVSNNSVAVNDLPQLIQNVHGALNGLSGRSAPEVRPEPKVPIRSSIKPDYIVCLEDGKKLKMLKPTSTGRNGAWPPIIRWSRRIMRSSAGNWPRRSALAPSAARRPKRNSRKSLLPGPRPGRNGFDPICATF